jgi:hypothetical protein
MRGVWRALLLAGMAMVVATEAMDAQLYYQPQPRPLVTAENEQWFRSAQPITFDGNFYYAAGPRVYFDGNVMVRTGAYRGVPLYADATREPYSMVFVPLSGGLMQPYERRRTGDAAGGTGTQAPSFPVDIAGERGPETTARAPWPIAPGPPVATQPDELLFDETMSDASTATRRRGAGVAESGTPGGASTTPVPTRGVSAPRNVLEAGARPKGLNEIYVTYDGYRWRSAGMAVPFRAEEYQVIGDYRGHPVYASRKEGGAQRIFLQGRSGFVAPYQRAGAPVRY